MSVYNEDELQAPKWLNEAFFEKVLGAHTNDPDVEVVELRLSPASMKGDHYASVMFRAAVDYRFSRTGPVAQQSMIVKTLPDEGVKREVLTQGRLFETEIGMYAKTLPRIEQILAEHGDPVQLAPKIIYHALTPNNVIVLEDLCTQGYGTVRGRHLTLEELQAIYRKIAKLHAVSYMLGQSESEADRQLVTQYQDGIFSSELVMSNPLFAGGVRKFIEMLSTHDEFDAYAPKLKAMEPELFASCMKLYRSYTTGGSSASNVHELFVLNHGDFHLKNLMFKFSKKTQFEDVLMVDFQVSVFAPSVIDMAYSNCMMLSSEQRARRNELMHFYFTEFVATLRRIQFQGELPKFADFQIASIKHRHFAVMLLSTFLPIVYGMLLQRPEDMKDQKEDIFSSEDAVAMLYRNPALIEEVKRLLPQMLYDGYLD